MNVELISWTLKPIETIANAASVCYQSKPSINIVKHCVESGHQSILEFANFVFKISDIDRATANQLVRHRIASYAQLSQRYVNMEDANFIYPSEITKEQKNIYDEAFNMANEAYKNLQKSGLNKETSRAVLPNASPTTIFVSMNLRSLSNFMGLRLCERAQKPIRDMAIAMKKEIKRKQKEMMLNEQELNLILSLLKPKCAIIGYCPEKNSCNRCITKEELNHLIKEYYKKEDKNA